MISQNQLNDEANKINCFTKIKKFEWAKNMGERHKYLLLELITNKRLYFEQNKKSEK